jgi:hypothetical protein
MSNHRYALVGGGLVQQVAFFDSDYIDPAWLSAVTEQFDLVQEVTDHPFPVNVGDSHNDEEGFRPPSPYPSWEWSETKWVAPIPKPDGPNWYWYEDTGQWVYVGPPPSEQPTIATL